MRSDTPNVGHISLVHTGRKILVQCPFGVVNRGSSESGRLSKGDELSERARSERQLEVR
jgi:hypothetical protein